MFKNCITITAFWQLVPHFLTISLIQFLILEMQTSGYATWFTAGGAIRIAHYDVIDDVITRKL